MAVLYRKYRPQSFSEVKGQKNIIKTLQNQVKQGRVAHAYLFTGSRGVGKTSIARILAKALNCKNFDQNGDACKECEVCKAIELGNFIDLIEIDAASNTGVDNIREIIEHIKFAPSVGKSKVFIIDEVHMLSKGAFNALLKTLEEPPKHAVFILATTEIQKVPATIVSRTQKFDFKSLGIEELKVNLKEVAGKENLSYAEEIYNLVSENAGGSVRDSLSILDKISTLGNGAEVADIRALLGVTDQALLKELLGLIDQGKAKELPEFFDQLLEVGVDFAVFNKDFLEFLRQILVQKLIGVEEDLSFKNLSIPDLIFIIRLFLKSFKDMQGFPSPEIPLLLSAIEAALKKNAAKVVSNTPVPKKENVETVVQKVEEVVKVSGPETVQTVNFSELENISLEEVNTFWPQVLEKIKEVNGPLGSLLKSAGLSGVENGKIVLFVKYQFDQKTIDKNSYLILKTLKEVSGKNLGLTSKIQEGKTENSPAVSIADALQVFGGEIVE